MVSSLLIPALSAILAIASPIDNTQPRGTNPISIASAEFLGNQTADNSCSHRDLGFPGSINGKWYAVYGDTLWCAPGVTDPLKDDTSSFHGMVRDSVSLMTEDPLKVHDLFLNDDSPVPHQKQFVPYNASWGEDASWGFGGTSLCETDADAKEAAIFFLRNANDDGLKGAGIGRVKVLNGTPTVVERYGHNGYWWDSSTNPRYGDLLAYCDIWSDYIYAVGGAPTNVTDFIGSCYSYMVRVKKSEAFDLSKYQYWHGVQRGWSSTRLETFNSNTAIFWGVGQGQIVWNAHYDCYIFVHLSIAGDQVLLRTAKRPEGPWSADVKAYDVSSSSPGGGMAYAGVAYPYLDHSGQTLTVAYTKMPNCIEVVKLTFV
ncbi:hypothetical protein NA57DRAFT_37277 [Rhizodiscina lignyota]|uniref:DUF4185 domain-containing protein n=1 Tax=Rhizodiscina lignyota TaxID=1504668 RepID=A0A9P4M7T2_9PEZI|nr:hypothetical protein NA57DRAFT_37277 [Rhizodiscina lignyota]